MDEEQCGSVFWTAHNFPWNIYATPFYEDSNNLEICIMTAEGDTILTHSLPYPWASHKEYWNKGQFQYEDRELRMYMEWMTHKLPEIIQFGIDRENGNKPQISLSDLTLNKIRTILEETK